VTEGDGLNRTPSIVTPANESGGAHTSRTMMLSELEHLLSFVPEGEPAEAYKAAVIDFNALGKSTHSGRMRAYRYLRELYVLDPANLLFRCLRTLWGADVEEHPLLALLVSMARDPALRATADPILNSIEGTRLDWSDFAKAVQKRYPDSYGEGIGAKIGRNAASSWTQAGHLSGRYNKVRARANATPATVALALFIGHTEGVRGDALFDTLWCRIQDRETSVLRDLAQRASQRGLIEFRSGGGVTEVGFKMLLRPIESEDA